MRKLATTLAVLLVTAVSLALAGEDAADKTATSEVTTEVVSMNLDQQTVTLKAADGKMLTLPVKGEALASLKNKKVMAGDTVIATLQNNDQGKHEAVTKLTKA